VKLIFRYGGVILPENLDTCHNWKPRRGMQVTMWGHGVPLDSAGVITHVRKDGDEKTWITVKTPLNTLHCCEKFFWLPLPKREYKIIPQKKDEKCPGKIQ
jgi:hypothetical protein